MARTVVVSGGGSGIGKAMAARFVADGDQMTIVGRRADVLAAAAGELNASLPGQVSWQAADLRRPDEVLGAVTQVQGTVDVVVNNAGGVASRGDGGDGLEGWPVPGRPTTGPTSSLPCCSPRRCAHGCAARARGW
jgi:3-oxoacyl-[acyl-carrier protein] reductase